MNIAVGDESELELEISALRGMTELRDALCRIELVDSLTMRC